MAAMIEALDDVDDAVGGVFVVVESSNLSNLRISASNAAISFLYTRFCTSTRYCSSRLSSITNLRVLYSIFNPILWITGSVTSSGGRNEEQNRE